MRDTVRLYGRAGKVYTTCVGDRITIGKAAEGFLFSSLSDVPFLWAYDTFSVPASESEGTRDCCCHLSLVLA